MDISGGGFVDYGTTFASKQIWEISNTKPTKPPPEMSLGISQNEKTRPREDFRQK